MKICRKSFWLAVLLVLSLPLTVSADSLTLYAAGSLKAALTDVAASYEKTYPTKVTTKFGPSGLLRKAIEGGESPDVFASANMAHPEKLASGGWGSPVVLFARNQLCAIAQPEQSATTDKLLDMFVGRQGSCGDLDPESGPKRRLCLGAFQKGGPDKGGKLHCAFGQGASTDRRAEQRQGPGRAQSIRMGSRWLQKK